MRAAPCSIMTFLPSMVISTSAEVRGVEAKVRRADEETRRPAGLRPRNIPCRIIVGGQKERTRGCGGRVGGGEGEGCGGGGVVAGCGVEIFEVTMGKA